jgi:hypothetical protein
VKGMILEGHIGVWVPLFTFDSLKIYHSFNSTEHEKSNN